jgi:galactokinase
MGGEPTQTWWVPGRVELLGKHTDYAGGRSLLCAIDRGIVLMARPRRDAPLRVVDAVRGERIEFAAGERPAAPAWALYPAVVAERLARDFPGATVGADIVFASDLPAAAGMSSSSALMIAVFLGLAGGTPVLELLGGREQWATYVAAVEGGRAWRGDGGAAGVGTHGGSEDHTAILCCKPGVWSQFSFCPVWHEADFAAPEDMRLVIGVSGVVAEKTGAALALYNRASALAREALAAWNAATGRADAFLRDVAPRGFDAFREAADVDMDTRLRFKQFWMENEVLIPEAGAALRQRDWPAFAQAVATSQYCAEYFLCNQVPETVTLVALAREHGAVAASAFGAGFGGAVWALAPATEAERFRAAWEQAYRAKFPQRAAASQFFLTAAGPAAQRLT